MPKELFIIPQNGPYFLVSPSWEPGYKEKLKCLFVNEIVFKIWSENYNIYIFVKYKQLKQDML